MAKRPRPEQAPPPSPTRRRGAAQALAAERPVAGGEPPGPVRYRVVYWEGEGIRFAQRDFAGRGRRPPEGGPCLCGSCSGVVGAHRHRMDNMQSTLRMCKAPGEEHFRKEVQEFVCLSPASCIRYDLQSFDMCALGLCEKAVIGAAVRASRSDKAWQQGVMMIHFAPARRDDPAAAVDWLRDYAAQAREEAEEADGGGAAVVVLLDVNGIEVAGLAGEAAMFAHAPSPRIREVVVLLGGPSGIGDEVLPRMLWELDQVLRVVMVRLPGGLQHSYVALGALLSYHDRGFLVPTLEDVRLLGDREYARQRERVRGGLNQLAAAMRGSGLPPAAMVQALREWRSKF